MSIEQSDFFHILLAERGSLLGFIQSLVRDAHLAEDVFQTVVVAAIRKREQINTREHLLKWLRKAARLEAMSAARKAAAHKARLDESVLDLLDGHWSRHDGDEGSARMSALLKCVERLTPNARRILNLRYSDGLTGDRLASAMNRNLNTVYVALARIHKALAGCIEERLRSEGVELG